MAQCMHRFCATCIEKWLRLSKCVPCWMCSPRSCWPQASADACALGLQKHNEHWLIDACVPVQGKCVPAVPQSHAVAARLQGRRAL